ncbi:MAG TPA: putative selenate reductase subunit YgfK [Desulfocapsa sulfexigens]|nr:putative selenate reductase subunit YgfK [Desulfocapsa sulfexigens]
MKKDLFFCTDIDVLLKWILTDLDENNEIFGIHRDQFFIPDSANSFRMSRYGNLLETPLGVASGPHTQLAQNIVAAWLTGSRYIELKTVQVLDELDVTKPCIDMTDEGYNCEWSQELKLDESFNEYLNGFILLYILRDKLGFSGDEAGFIFNMSAGYELKGIHSPTVQNFFDRMEDCSKELAEKIEKIADIYPRVKELDIPSRISDSLTISTMHGCPPDEIEKIARYFIEDRGYHTTIKLNPTLLGPERLRDILNNKLDFEIDVPDLAFEHDLKYPDAIKLIQSLIDAADKKGVEFNIKLTNTLETTNIDQDLPKTEAMCYMSGRALHPISINLAARLQEEFDGKLDLSFCAGVDNFNIFNTLTCGMAPVTVCSDVLKPGGYARVSQYAVTILEGMKEVGADSLDKLVCDWAGDSDPVAAGLANLKTYAANVTDSGNYSKDLFPYQNVKTERNLPTFDCAGAPCVTSCGASQNVPRYMDYTARGDFENAYKTILATNPFPNMQGMVCDHPCQYKCTRLNYDSPLLIREIKRFIAENQKQDIKLTPLPDNGKSVAIIGAGPSGLSAAFFLRLEGFQVDLYESKEFVGGMASDGIPVFRLDNDSLNKDVNRILALGARLHTCEKVDQEKFTKLRQSHDFVYIAIGAQASSQLNIPGADAIGMFDHLDFLSDVRQSGCPDIGKKVIIIGAGNSAMDAARTAKRIVGPDGEVSIVYRRTRRQMPADHEEITAAIEEGVKVIELAGPAAVQVRDGKVTGLEVARMKLGKPDASGRRSPVRIEGEENYVIPAESIIVAIGQRVELGFLPDGELSVDRKSLRSSLPGVLAGGDVIDVSSLINAIGHGRRATNSIIAASGLKPQVNIAPTDDRKLNLTELQKRNATRQFGVKMPELPAAKRFNFDLFVGTLSKEDAIAEASRCLQCDLVCNVCVTVCPNRANVALRSAPVSYPVQVVAADGSVETISRIELTQAYQIINIADFCNECGNCQTFCPTSGAPYMDKSRVHLSAASLEAHGEGFFMADSSTMRIMHGGKSANLTKNDDTFLFEDDEVKLSLAKDSLQATVIELKTRVENKSIQEAAEAAILFNLLEKRKPFVQ